VVIVTPPVFVLVIVLAPVVDTVPNVTEPVPEMLTAVASATLRPATVFTPVEATLTVA
jgi:hypothetical protein